MTIYILNCLVHGESTENIFQVVVDNSDANEYERKCNSDCKSVSLKNISELREAIVKKKPCEFSYFDPEKLHLWKVLINSSLKSSAFKALRDNPQADIEKVLKGKKIIDPTKDIFDIWDPDKMIHNSEAHHIHLIIKPPPKLKRSHREDEVHPPKRREVRAPECTVERFGKTLLDGKFTIVYGDKLCVKSIMTHVATQWLKSSIEYKRGDFEIYHILLNGYIVVEGGSTQFWTSVCEHFRVIDSRRFAFDDTKGISKSTFESFFSKSRWPIEKPFILIIDITRLQDCDIGYEFVSLLKSIKKDGDSFNLRACALVGNKDMKKLFISDNSSRFSSVIYDSEFEVV
jgi:hypothetical protein